MRCGARAAAARLTGLLCLCELAWHGFALIQVAPAATFLDSDPICEAILLRHPNQPRGEPTRVRARDAFFLDLEAVRYGIEKTNLNDAFQLAHAAALYRHSIPWPLDCSRYRKNPCRSRSMTSEGESAKACLIVRAYPILSPTVSRPTLRGRLSSRGHFTREPLSSSRIRQPFLVPMLFRAEVVEDDDSTTVLSQFRSSDPRGSVLMDHDPLSGLPSERRQRFTPAQWISQDPDRPMLEVTTEAPGLLVVADTWMPGWSALVDGQPASILRGNHAQRVIPLKQPGRHSVLLRYRPPGLAAGCVISACAVLVWVTLCHLISGLRGRSRWDWR